MILVTGGLGMIGAHTAAGLADLGEEVLVTAHRHRERASFLGERVSVAAVDVRDADAVKDLGRGRDIDGVVHLAGSVPGADPVAFLRAETTGLLAVLDAARHWGVRRLAVASSLGVYAGRPEPVWTETLPLPTGAAPHLIVAYKKALEPLVLNSLQVSDIQPILLRIGSIWGPLMDPWSPFNPVMPMVNAALSGQPAPPLDPVDGGDCCYAPDAGRAIAALMTVPRLDYEVYNVSSGSPVTFGQIADALADLTGRRPALQAPTPAGARPCRPYLDIGRLIAQTGFAPQFDVTAAVAHYAAWRTHNPR